ncbi:MAG TPA: hypothetical protein VFZ43_05585 [Anaerolineales bacterium]
MKVQNLTPAVKIFNLVIGLAPIELAPTRPIQACSRDYGFDFDEEEIGRELLSPLPANLVWQTIPMIDAEEFEKLYL